MSGSQRRGSSIRRTTIEPVVWTVWLLRDRPRVTLILAAAFAALGLLTSYLMRSPLWGVAAAAVMVVATWRWWTPLQFEVHSRGLTQRALGRTRGIEWGDIQRCEVRASGILVSFAAPDAPLGALRRLYIPFGDRRGEVVAALSQVLGGEAAG